MHPNLLSEKGPAGQLQEEKGKSCYPLIDQDQERICELIDVQLVVSTLYAIGVLLDYFFVYIAMIIEDQKCIRLNKTFGFSALAFRTLLEIINVIIFWYKFDFGRFRSKLPRQDKAKYIKKMLLGSVKTRQEILDFLMLHQLLGIILVSLVYQVMLVIAIATEGKKGLIFIALNYLLWLHLPRLFVVINILLKRPKTTGIRLCTRLARLFFFLYVYSSQIFAALWYLPAIYKETRCWHEAYRITTGHGYNVFNCHAMTSEQNNFVNSYCYSNTTKYDFGIYATVHKSGVLGGKSSVMQILYFSRWAMQCLSSFGQGLEAGANFTQNIFIILMIVYGVFMFFFLIGEVQSDRDRYLKMTPKFRATEEWMDKNNLPRDLRLQIKKHMQNKKRESRFENLENIMLYNLSNKLRAQLTHELCFELLKKVEEFGKWSDASLEKLCENLKPRFYPERTRIIQERDPVTQVIFVVKGRLWKYEKSVSPSTDSGNSGCSHLGEGDISGSELVSCLLSDPNTSVLPISTVTIEVVEKVEAFVLTLYDLRIIIMDLRVPVSSEE